MGANPWWYLVDYQPDIESAIQALRQREFKAGRYFPAINYASFPITSDYSAPGAQHASIEAANEAAGLAFCRTVWQLSFGQNGKIM